MTSKNSSTTKRQQFSIHVRCSSIQSSRARSGRENIYRVRMHERHWMTTGRMKCRATSLLVILPRPRRDEKFSKKFRRKACQKSRSTRRRSITSASSLDPTLEKNSTSENAWTPTLRRRTSGSTSIAAFCWTKRWTWLSTTSCPRILPTSARKVEAKSKRSTKRT